MPSKKKTSRKSRSPYKYNRKNNLLKQTSKKKKSRTRIKKSNSRSRKRYSSSAPKSRKVKSKSPRKLVDINVFQYRKKSGSGNDGFQKVKGRRRKISHKSRNKYR